MSIKRILRVMADTEKRQFAIDYVSQDFLTRLRISKNRGKIIFISGLPKSGSTWLFQAIREIPGFNRRLYQSPVYHNEDGLILSNFDDVSISTFASHPAWGCSVYKEHTQFNAENWRIISEGANRCVVLTRELKDVMTSLYFHHKVDKGHDYYPLISPLNTEMGIQKIMELCLEDFFNWTKNWLEAKRKYSNQILHLDYSELWSQPEEAMNKIKSFYQLNLTHDELSLLQKTKISKKTHLSNTLTKKLNNFSTARKGGVGGWEDHFTQGHLDHFHSVVPHNFQYE